MTVDQRGAVAFVHLTAEETREWTSVGEVAAVVRCVLRRRARTEASEGRAVRILVVGAGGEPLGEVRTREGVRLERDSRKSTFGRGRAA